MVHGEEETPCRSLTPVLMRLSVSLALAASLAAPFVPLPAQPADTLHGASKPLFTSADAVLAGAVLAGTLLMVPLDREFAEELQDSLRQSNRFLQRQATFFRLIAEPGALIIGGTMYAAGKLSSNEEMADLGLHGTEAIVIGSAVTAVLKAAFGRARPYVDRSDPLNFRFGRGVRGSEYRSFPSGHALAGFAAAAAVTAEASRFWSASEWYVGPVMYGGAALIGFSRMYNNKHWASDVVMAAGIGTFSGLKIVRWHHSNPGNSLDRWLLGATVAPAAEGGGKTVRLWVAPIRDPAGR